MITCREMNDLVAFGDISTPTSSFQTNGTWNFIFMDMTTMSGLSNATTGDSTYHRKEHTIDDAFVPMLPEDFVKDFGFVATAIVTPVLCIIGIFGNSLGVGIIWRDMRRQKMSIHMYLFALILFDIIFLAISLVRVVPSIIEPTNRHLANYVDAHMKYIVIYLDMNFTYASRAMVFVMSCERLLSLVKPLHVKNMWLGKYPVRIITICFTFNALFLMPVPINSEVVLLPVGNSSEYIFRFKNYKTFMASYWLIQVIVQEIIPILSLIIINIAIPVQFYRISKERLSSLTINQHSMGKQQKKLTVTVMIITAMYILLSLPMIVILCLQYVSPDYSTRGKYRLIFWFAVDITNLLSYVNAANDFLVYFLVSNKYRALFKKRLCCCLDRASEYFNKDSTLSLQSEKTNIGSFAVTVTDQIL